MNYELVTPQTEEIPICGLVLRRDGVKSLLEQDGGEHLCWWDKRHPTLQVYWTQDAKTVPGAWSARIDAHSHMGLLPSKRSFAELAEHLQQVVLDAYLAQGLLTAWALEYASSQTTYPVESVPAPPLQGPHLWDIKHEGYWGDRAYHAKPADVPFVTYATWEAFFGQWGVLPLSYADPQVVGFDWVVDKHHEDPYYRSGQLNVYFLTRRTGYYQFTQVSVCPADESAVRAFLQRHLNKLLELWQPLEKP